MLIPPLDLSPDEQSLWARVNELWSLTLMRDPKKIEAALHPEYVGWDMSLPTPHDRAFAVSSVSGQTPPVVNYSLQPLSVRVYEDHVGVVHYRYTAFVARNDSTPVKISGMWTEVYLKQAGEWLMVTVSGRPDPHGEVR